MVQNSFLTEFLNYIIEGLNIPKFQVERAISPIIGTFIESILTEFFKTEKNSSEDYELIQPEFPLKKVDSNQSTNIDFLLINKTINELVLLELKTDVSSIRQEQIEIYNKVKEKVKRTNASRLIKDLNSIYKATKKKNKYKHLLDKIEKYDKDFKRIKNVKLLVIAPQRIKSRLQKNEYIDKVITFKELPKIICHQHAKEWELISKKLNEIDTFYGENHTNINATLDNYEKIQIDVKKYCSKKGTSPEFIRFGITGLGKKPNYQLEFKDGSKQTFYFSGKEHKLDSFNERNLTNKIKWEDFNNKPCSFSSLLIKKGDNIK